MKKFASILVEGLLAKRAIACSIIGILLGVSFLTAPPAGLQNSWFDLMNQIWPRERKSEPVVIVTIDESSVEAIGAWPWPRAVNAELMARIAAGQPAAVGMDIIYAEKDALGVHQDALANHPGAPKSAQDWLSNLKSGDHDIAEAMAGFPFVLAVGDVGVPPRDPSDLGEVVLERGEDARAAIHTWTKPFQPLRSHGLIREAAAGEGVVAQHDDFDGVARRTGQVFDIGHGMLAPGFVTELLRVASGATFANVESDRHGVRDIALLQDGEPIFRIKTEADGAVRPWYGPRDPAREVPAIHLMRDDDELARIQGKIVLVGYAAAGGLDERISPLGQLIPGVEAHRQTIESIFDEAMLYRPYWAEQAEFIAGLALILAAAFAPTRLRLVWGMGAGLAFAGLPIVITLGAYTVGRLVFDGATTAGAVTLTGGLALVAAMAMNERERRVQQAARQRIDGEMAAARRMQMGILPEVEGALAADPRFSIAALTEPARTVGGDLYDFFLLDEKRLFFLVGDVAGKGPEASLFMAISKSLLKSAALRSEGDLGAILTEANREIARDNPASTFVTVFAAILDTETGVLDYCCGGHEPPWRTSLSGPPERLEGIGGPPLCLLDEFDYPADVATLSPGDMVLVVTDGVTEAANRSDELFGVGRTEETIAKLGDVENAAAALKGLVKPVHIFAEGREPADDLTALAVIWRGPGAA